MVDDLLSEIRSAPGVADRMRMITDADDELLSALYTGAAFCVYPSAYEGYGLPVIEAFAHGKAMLVSTGGALPELVGDLSPCLDPTDEDAWYRAKEQWIECPQTRKPFEEAVQRRFRHGPRPLRSSFRKPLRVASREAVPTGAQRNFA
jgi:glycosyltransferase involved in cell wall biosynthesis